MADRPLIRLVCALMAATLASATLLVAQGTPKNYTVPRTPWGDPDLQGKWPGSDLVGVPLQRDVKYGTRNRLTEEEFRAREAQFAQQEQTDNADFDPEHPVGTPGDVGSPTSPPPHWLERGKPQSIASLIVDPPDGRMPPATPESQERNAAAAAARRGRGPADSYTEPSLYDRCITRGVAGSILPGVYNNGNEILQGPGYVVLRNEMIHEARVVPLDGRPHPGSDVRMWMGDARGH